MESIIIYNEGELELKVSVDNDTIWLNQIQMSELFDTSVDNISLHLKNIYKEKELNENSTIEDFSIVRKEGHRTVKRKIKHYNLDAIISVGYRVSSLKATKFRQWATLVLKKYIQNNLDAIISVGYRVSSLKATKFRQWATLVLKKYIQNGYAINTHKITEQRLLSIESDIDIIKSKIKNDSLQISQDIFYDGQVFDAYTFILDLIRGAKKEIILIDNYIDDTTLTIFSKTPNIKVTIYTHTISKQLSLDFQKYNTQYKNITLKTFKNSHDRFLILDNKELYHLGASLKDLGKKWFAFSKVDIESVNILEKLKGN